MSDAEQQPGPTGAEPPADRGPAAGGGRRFVRTRRGRLIGGVCSGLGSYFGVDPILFRVAFVGLVFLGGVGLGIYLLILLLVPEEGARRAPIRNLPLGLSTVLGLIALIIAAGLMVDLAIHNAEVGWGIASGLGAIAIVGALAVALWWHLRRRPQEDRTSPDRRLFRILALLVAAAAAAALAATAGAWLAGVAGTAAAWVVVALGAALIVTAFTGGARWLAVPAVAFSLPVAVFIAADVDLRGGVGERTYRPAEPAAVADSYRLGLGRLEVDLRDVSFPPGDTAIELGLGVGQLVLLVPSEVCVATSAELGAGYVGALDRETGGLDVDWSNRPEPPAGTSRLLVSAELGLGALFVADRPIERHRWGDRRENFEPGVYGDNDACLEPGGGEEQ